MHVQRPRSALRRERMTVAGPGVPRGECRHHLLVAATGGVCAIVLGLLAGAATAAAAADTGNLSVSCSSPTSCVAVDGLGNVATYTAGGWNAPPGFVGLSGLESLACPAVAGPCMALREAGYLIQLANGGYSITYQPTASSSPTISGTATVGAQLTENAAVWQNGPTGFVYQWQRCDTSGNACEAIAGATGQRYTLTGNDVGHTIRVAETASNAYGASAPATSSATGVVVALSLTGNAAGAAPGATTVGSTPVTTTPGTASSGSSTSGGAGNSVTSGASQVGASVTGPPANTSRPTVSRTTANGGTVSCTPGSWSGQAPQVLHTQWLRDGKPIAGATGASHVLVVADTGHALSCRVTASNPVGSASATSAPFAVTAATVTFARAVANYAARLGRVHAANVAKAGFTAPFTAPGAGTVVLTLTSRSGHTTLVLASGRKRFKAAGNAPFTLRMTTAGASRLATAARVKATLAGVYTPTRGRRSTAHSTVNLRK